ncbi:MAG: hypothetical protein V3U51_00550 [Thermoplasmata archaeon]
MKRVAKEKAESYLAVMMMVLFSLSLSGPLVWSGTWESSPNGLVWSIETVDNSTPQTGFNPSIDLDSQNYPHIVHYDWTGLDLRYARWNGSAWIKETVDSAGDVGYYSSIAVDSMDRAHISYWDNTNGNLKYALWDGTSWIIEVLDPTWGHGWYNSIAVDSNNVPHVSYFANGDLNYAVRTSGWIIETVDDSIGAGWHTSIAVDNNDKPHIAYGENKMLSVKYAKKTTGWWITEELDSVNSLSPYPDIAIDSNNRPHISYIDEPNSDLKYARWTGSSWSIEVAYGSAGYETSIAVDSQDRPHIGFRPVAYTSWNGTAWSFETVDPSGFSPSIVLDSNDNPVIAYSHSSPGGDASLRYARGIPGPMPPPRAPEIQGAVLSGGNLKNVTLTWALSPDDGLGFSNVENYRILRGTTFESGGLGYSVLADVPSKTTSFVDAYSGEGSPNTYFYQVCAVDLSNNSTCAVAQVAKFTRPLSKGPNLVSIPLIQSDETIQTVLQTVSYDNSWSYDPINQEWRSFSKSKPYGQSLEYLNHTMGIWVNVTQDSNLAVAGVVPSSTTIDLQVGWNLVGFPSFDDNFTVADLKAVVAVERIEGFDGLASPYSLRVMMDGDILQAGIGYWIRVESPAIWTIENV